MIQLSRMLLSAVTVLVAILCVPAALGASSNWTLAAPGLPAARQGACFVYDAGRQKAVLFGGYSGVLRNDTWTFDGTRWSPTAPSQSPPAREGAGSAYDPDIGKMIIFGGIGGSVDGISGLEIFGDTWSWDGTNWTEISTGDPTGMTQPGLREYPAMAYDPNHHQVILFGGWNGNYAQYLNDTWAFDGQSWTQLHPPNLPAGRSNAAMAFDPVLGQLVLFGGSSVTGGVMGDMWTWTGSNWVQLNPTVLPQRRYSPSLTLDESNGRLVLFGGVSASGSAINDTWTWDGSSWQIQSPSRPPAGRSKPAATYLPTIGRIVLFSGVVTGFEFLQDTWAWDGTQWSLLPVPPLGRFDPSMAWDPAMSAVVLFGGQSFTAPTGPGFLNDTWTWNGSAWAQQHPVTSPSPRNSSGMAYDPALGKLVLFGGLGNVIVGDTWLWDGTNWTRVSTAHSPSPREDPAMVYDAALGKIVLFGGQGVFDSNTATSYLADTWVFDGNDWTQVLGEDQTGTTAPRRRSLAAAAYDSINQVVVLHGGQADTAGSVSVQRGDTWTFNGTSWTQVSVDDPTGQSAPSPRAGARMEYAPALGGLILFGGLTNQGAVSPYANDTWKWNGTAWAQLHPTTSPDGRQLFGSAYDAVRQQIVLFGGGTSSNSFGSDTWLFGLPPVQLVGLVSRKAHGSAGTFDIDLINGNGIECRTGGTSGNYTLVFTFANPLISVGGANVSTGTGTVSSRTIDGANPHNYIVNLTGISNAQRITVSLSNVTDSLGNSSGLVTGSMGVLLGDVTANLVVSNTDVASIKAQVAAPVTTSNFRNDVNANGIISNTDVSTTKAQVGTSLP
jgi:hypothetical protein